MRLLPCDSEVMMRIYQFELRVLLIQGEGLTMAEALELDSIGSGSDQLEALASLAADVKTALEHGEAPYREPPPDLLERWIAARDGTSEAMTLKIWGAYDAPQVTAAACPSERHTL